MVKIVKFSCHGCNAPAYGCSLPGDNSGSYVLHSDYAELERRLAELVGAVGWERECCQDIRPLVAWAGLYVLHGEDYVDAVAEALREIQDAARAEVDRLIANESAADCEGEG